MSRLGCLYSDGEGVSVDYEKSIEWDLKAIEQGEESSMLNLAITFRMAGELSKASHWFRKALKFGNGEAALELAKLFMASDKDQKNIRKYLTIASKHQNICEDSRREATELLSKLDTTS